MRPANIRPGYIHGMKITPALEKWISEVRQWCWVMDSYGSYQRVEDK